MLWEQISIQSSTGASLNTYKSLPDGEPKAVVQINHGMAEHAQRYQHFATALAEAGYGAYAHDHRGHGHTTAPNSAKGHFARKDGWAKVIADADAVNAEIRNQYPNSPVICFGHSMGAIAALSYAIQHRERIAGLAIWNISVDGGPLLAIYRGLLKTEQFFKGSDVPSRIAPKLSFDAWNKEFAPNRTDFDWLSGDEAEVDKYIADPLCGFDATVGMWLAISDGIRLAANDANLAKLPSALPVHLLAGEKDPVSLHGKAMENLERRMRTIGMTDVNFTLLEHTRHESLNELNRDETTQAFIKWLNELFDTR